MLYAADERLTSRADVVPYDELRAFDTGTSKGWGVCCMQPIRKGQVLGEATGRCLTEAQFEALDNKLYVFGFSDEMLQRKRALGDEVRYIDLREHGNMMRLVNDETEAPNVHLMYWPEERKDPPRLPRRCFLVAKRDVPLSPS